jgi:hypothetical protein
MTLGDELAGFTIAARSVATVALGTLRELAIDAA